jgi:hypothetical protein
MFLIFQTHLKNVPDYIVPKALKKVTGQSRPQKRKLPTGSGGQSAAKRKFEKKQADALFSLASKKRK